jgi:hypothetical protein
MFIDQLTFVEHPDPGRKPRNEIVGDEMHELKALISTGNDPIACLVAHQINRVGVEAARKTGFMLMEYMAESAAVERTADWVFSLHQNASEKISQDATLQILAARREELKAWSIKWRPTIGGVMITSEVAIDA